MMSHGRVDAPAMWARHTVALAALAKTLEALRDAKVSPLVVKGIVLAYSIYDDVTERPIRDIDLRVRPSEFGRAVRAMRRRGWTPEYGSRQLGCISFYVGETLVDIETTIGPPGLCKLTVAEMLSRSRERRLPGGLVVREPELVDHALLMVVNTFKDKIIDTMPWSLGDLERFAAHPEFRVETFLERAAAARVRTITWIVADWLARQQGSERWRSVRDAIGIRPPRWRYAEIMRRRIEQAPHTETTRIFARIGSDSVDGCVCALGTTVIGAAIRWIRA